MVAKPVLTERLTKLQAVPIRGSLGEFTLPKNQNATMAIRQLNGNWEGEAPAEPKIQQVPLAAIFTDKPTAMLSKQRLWQTVSGCCFHAQTGSKICV
ncbi:MAG: hypothetical protein N3B10_15220 [Armatimonadetes bacterium]|nr:hypothetical protein [Armatimonadota bacterium]